MVVVEKYNKICRLFEEANGNNKVLLFAILKMDEIIDRWSILISAPWIEDSNRKDIFKQFISILQKDLNQEELSEIARISFPSVDEHLIELFVKDFQSGQHIKEDAKINGNIIHEGFIIALNKDASISQPNLNLAS